MMKRYDMMTHMKTLETCLTERGQVSIPASVRKKMHLRPGQKLRWQVVSGAECRVLLAESGPVPGATAMLGYARQFRKTRRTSDWMRELREGEEKR